MTRRVKLTLIFLHIMSISIAHGQVKPNDVDKREHSE
jgi:hypothetical protein